MEPSKKAKNIDDYIGNFPKGVQRLLKQLRSTIKKAAPQAKETISYRIPTFTLRGYLVHFAAFKDHVSLFPTSSPVRTFKKALSRYKVSRGTIQFPLDRPLPLTLVSRIVKFRVKENLAGTRRRPNTTRCFSSIKAFDWADGRIDQFSTTRSRRRGVGPVSPPAVRTVLRLSYLERS